MSRWVTGIAARMAASRVAAEIGMAGRQLGDSLEVGARARRSSGCDERNDFESALESTI